MRRTERGGLVVVSGGGWGWWWWWWVGGKRGGVALGLTSRTRRRVRGPMCSANVLPTQRRSVASTRTTPPAKALVGDA